MISEADKKLYYERKTKTLFYLIDIGYIRGKDTPYVILQPFLYTETYNAKTYLLPFNEFLKMDMIDGKVVSAFEDAFKLEITEIFPDSYIKKLLTATQGNDKVLINNFRLFQHKLEQLENNI